MDIGINQQDRQELVAGLSSLLADSYFVYLKTHGYHWNVTGPLFVTLHDLFGQQYQELWDSLDLIAERIRALGHMAPQTYRHYKKLTQVVELEDLPLPVDMVKELMFDQELLIRSARNILPIADKAGDETTLDLLTQRLAVYEKNAWVLRSILNLK